MKILLIFLFFCLSFSHPLNLTKMDFNLSNNVYHLRFVSYNIENALKIKFDSENDIKKAADKISEYTKKHLKIDDCKLRLKKLKVSNEIVIDEYFTVECENYSDKMKIFFDMFFKNDKTQSGVLRVIDKNEYILNFNRKNTTNIIKIDKKTSFYNFMILGILHILYGFDHITFLITLLLPAVLYATSLKNSFKSVLIIATAFSVSHSISLMASALNIVEINAALIEMLIAVTIFLTALNNIYHIVDFKKEWLIAFLFGFIHGFAFSEAVRDLHIDFENFIKIVFGFNIGVEIGQVIIILSVGPILYYFIKKQKKIYYYLNFVSLVLSFLWFFDRMLNLNIMPF